ncbi:STAS domain-containing protein [Litorilituus lipolyticus]|uniref:Anti-sigma factor antagonist n=1 Tax=Litorilituus lipolyticus TaxID=2491017 RepID=A0A502L5R6_9GAMM|nr:STAS domain-containing protein [Litorilituus lipolyticus]TPH19260.1 anti-sigma factor antagonist [Litorilituus lipolyticus]
MPEIKVVQKRNNTTEVTISGELTIYEAQSFFTEHIQPLTIQQQLNLKLAKLTEVDTAGIQVLIMLLNKAQELTASIRIISLSVAIKDYCELFQLHHYFTVTKDKVKSNSGENP